jgi:hypothetical protein
MRISASYVDRGKDERENFFTGACEMFLKKNFLSPKARLPKKGEQRLNLVKS